MYEDMCSRSTVFLFFIRRLLCMWVGIWLLCVCDFAGGPMVVRIFSPRLWCALS